MIWNNFIIPKYVARVPVSLWGLRVCSRSQPFAIVRNRSRELRMAVPMGNFAKVVLFGGFRHLVISFRVAGAIFLRRFQKIHCRFHRRHSTLDVSIVIFRGRRSTLDVPCCVFFAHRIGRAASNGDKVKIP